MSKFFFKIPYSYFRKEIERQPHDKDDKTLRAFVIGRLIILWDVK